jgi:glutamate synthase (NADPH/NADH) large chain
LQFLLFNYSFAARPLPRGGRGPERGSFMAKNTASCAPGAFGLYDPRFEHDACGIGIVVNISGRKSNSILTQSLRVLRNLSHRGGVGSDPDSGDGSGILMQIPHAFMRGAASGICSLPEPGEYGVGMVFMPAEGDTRDKCTELIAAAVSRGGQKLLGWRDVPVRSECLGKTSRACMPYIRQVFIGRSGEISDADDFERRLYVIRRLAEKAAADENISGLYFASLSCRTIVYKGMLTPEQLGEFYLDLGDPDVVTVARARPFALQHQHLPELGARPSQPLYLIHNGEINTLRGNINRMNARESMLATDAFGDDLIGRVLPMTQSRRERLGHVR